MSVELSQMMRASYGARKCVRGTRHRIVGSAHRASVQASIVQFGISAVRLRRTSPAGSMARDSSIVLATSSPRRRVLA
jgi:hypothetical protein